MERRSPSFELEGGDELSSPPSKRLLTAILVRAIRDFVNYRDAKRGTESHKIAVDAAGWVFWEGDEKEFLSFRWVCAAIDIDPARTRRTMLSLTREDLLRMTPPDNENVGAEDEDEGE